MVSSLKFFTLKSQSSFFSICTPAIGMLFKTWEADILEIWLFTLFFMPEAHKGDEATKGHLCNVLLLLKKNVKN